MSKKTNPVKAKEAAAMRDMERRIRLAKQERAELLAMRDALRAEVEALRKRASWALRHANVTPFPGCD